MAQEPLLLARRTARDRDDTRLARANAVRDGLRLPVGEETVARADPRAAAARSPPMTSHAGRSRRPPVASKQSGEYDRAGGGASVGGWVTSRHAAMAFGQGHAGRAQRQLGVDVPQELL
jgi:hypothetical protein